MTTPPSLYALLVKIRPLQPGTLMPHSGELVHGALMGRFLEQDRELAARLHEGNERRLFTCSSLLFPREQFPAGIFLAQWKNTHLPVFPHFRYSIRLTFLSAEIYQTFAATLLPGPSGNMMPFLKLGKQEFLIEEVLISDEQGSGWTGSTSFEDLVNETSSFPPPKHCTLEFASPTGFHTPPSIDKRQVSASSIRAFIPEEMQEARHVFTYRIARSSFFSNHLETLPQAAHIFHGLTARWKQLAPPELLGAIDGEQLGEYLEEACIWVEDYRLKLHWAHLNRSSYPGFVGEVTFRMGEPDESVRSPLGLTRRQQLHLLAKLAFYTGVGYKTAMGMGQTRLHAHRLEPPRRGDRREKPGVLQDWRITFSPERSRQLTQLQKHLSSVSERTYSRQEVMEWLLSQVLEDPSLVSLLSLAEEEGTEGGSGA